MFPERPPSYTVISNSPMSSGLLGSSNTKGSVEWTILSVTMLSDVAWVFMMWPTCCWPHNERAHFAAVDFPTSNLMQDYFQV